MAEKNLQSWFWDKKPPSAQIAGLLIKAIFPFLLALASQVLIFGQRAPRPELGNATTTTTTSSLLLLLLLLLLLQLHTRHCKALSRYRVKGREFQGWNSGEHSWVYLKEVSMHLNCLEQEELPFLVIGSYVIMVCVRHQKTIKFMLKSIGGGERRILLLGSL